MVPTMFQARARSRATRAGLAIALAVALGGCSSARPALPSKPQERHVMRIQGAAMIDSLVAAHGGMENWNKVVEMSFRGTDEWTGQVAKMLNPWPVERASGQNIFRVHENRGRIAIVTDRGTLVYGVGRTGPWALLRGEPSPDPKDERTASYVVAWQGFMAGIPFRFKEHGAVAHYLGRKHREYKNASQEFYEVLVTYPPEGDVWPEDWFIVRMDPLTHEMRTLTYTTKNRAFKAFETTVEFGDYAVIDGLKIPLKRTCTLSAPFQDKLHVWDLADLRFTEPSPDDMFERRGVAAVAMPADTSAAAASSVAVAVPAPAGAAGGAAGGADTARAGGK